MSALVYTGQVLEFTYPFHDQFVDMWQGKKQTMLTPGCHKSEEDDGSGYGTSIYWTANCEGKIVFEVLSIAEMPGKYMDRVIVKKHYLKPCGEKLSRGDVVMMTDGKLKRYIDDQTVFPWEYEVDESFTADKPTYQSHF